MVVVPDAATRDYTHQHPQMAGEAKSVMRLNSFEWFLTRKQRNRAQYIKMGNIQRCATQNCPLPTHFHRKMKSGAARRVGQRNERKLRGGDGTTPPRPAELELCPEPEGCTKPEHYHPKKREFRQAMAANRGSKRAHLVGEAMEVKEDQERAAADVAAGVWDVLDEDKADYPVNPGVPQMPLARDAADPPQARAPLPKHGGNRVDNLVRLLEPPNPRRAAPVLDPPAIRVESEDEWEAADWSDGGGDWVQGFVINPLYEPIPPPLVDESDSSEESEVDDGPPEEIPPPPLERDEAWVEYFTENGLPDSDEHDYLEPGDPGEPLQRDATPHGTSHPSPLTGDAGSDMLEVSYVDLAVLGECPPTSAFGRAWRVVREKLTTSKRVNSMVDHPAVGTTDRVQSKFLFIPLPVSSGTTDTLEARGLNQVMKSRPVYARLAEMVLADNSVWLSCMFRDGSLSPNCTKVYYHALRGKLSQGTKFNPEIMTNTAIFVANSLVRRESLLAAATHIPLKGNGGAKAQNATASRADFPAYIIRSLPYGIPACLGPHRRYYEPSEYDPMSAGFVNNNRFEAVFGRKWLSKLGLPKFTFSPPSNQYKSVSRGCVADWIIHGDYPSTLIAGLTRPFTGLPASMVETQRNYFRDGGPGAAVCHEILRACEPHYPPEVCTQESLRAAAYAPHPKQKMRIAAYNDMREAGFTARAVEAMPGSKAPKYSAKVGEKSSRVKAPRVTADLGPTRSILGIAVTDNIKTGLAAHPLPVFGDNGRMCGYVQFMKGMNIPILKERFLRAVGGEPSYLLHSDDGYLVTSFRGRVRHFNVDISKADASYTAEAICSLLKIVPVHYRDRLNLLLRQLSLPIEVRGRSVEERIRYVLRDPNDRVLYSGSTLTTLVNTLVNMCLGYAFLRAMPTTADQIKAVALSLGFIVSVELCTEYEHVQFLKTSPVRTQNGWELAPNLGTLLRMYGDVRGEFPGAAHVPLSVRADAHCKSTVNGMYARLHIPMLKPLRGDYTVAATSQPIIDAEFAHKGYDTRPHEVTITDADYVRRYGLNSHEARLLAEDIERISHHGTYLQSRWFDIILHKDYGFPLRSTDTPIDIRYRDEG